MLSDSSRNTDEFTHMIQRQRNVFNHARITAQTFAQGAVYHKVGWQARMLGADLGKDMGIVEFEHQDQRSLDAFKKLGDF